MESDGIFQIHPKKSLCRFTSLLGRRDGNLICRSVITIAMNLYEVRNREPVLIQQLLLVWEESVRATHLFLSDAEIKKIQRYVPQALNEVEHLIVAENAARPVAFRVYLQKEEATARADFSSVQGGKPKV